MDVNSQNEVNGWTCLHWACKRNHGQVVSYLLKSGADKDILTTKGEMPVQLTSRREIRKIMGVEEDDDGDSLPQTKKESDLPFVPNYLASPAFPFIYTPVAEDSAPLQNGGPSTPPASPPGDSSPALLPPGEPPLLGAFPRDHPSLALVQNGDVSAPSAVLRTPVSQSRSLFSSVPSKPPVSLEPQNGTYAGPAPALQPFFFTGAFPFNMQGNSLSAAASADGQTASGAQELYFWVWGWHVFRLSIITDLQKSCNTSIRNSLYSDCLPFALLPSTV